MTAYIVFIRERIRSPEDIATYNGLAGPSLAGHNATPLVLYGKHETREGPPIDGAVMLAFPTMEEARAWYDGDAYTAARQHRFKGADYRVFITEGL
jgi:uncharacterized protein (DUF1330 family)